MIGLFQLLGIAVGLYALHGLATGETYAKSGVFGRRVRRDDEGFAYWSTISVYGLLALVLFFWF